MMTVFVGLSGGVDSSVSAALLKRQGYNVVGVYMKNWSRDLPGMPCPWRDDFTDAKRVAVQLGIDFKMYDFEKDYRQKVVDYMLDEFKAGRTPNPDIMCNQEIKFKLFLETALEDGADLIATGHYARVENEERRMKNEEGLTRRSPFAVRRSSGARLLMARDENKDQTYFLHRIDQAALSKALFPLGGYTKPQVRELAKKFGLVTADKKESMGICFVGKIGIKEFLQHQLFQGATLEKGPIINQNGKIIGQHDGAIFYTIGQRRGLEVGGGRPYYVTAKDMAKNEVYVTSDLQDEKLWSREIKLTSIHWIDDQSQNEERRTENGEQQPRRSSFVVPRSLYVRLRHRGDLLSVKRLSKLNSGQWHAELESDVRALTPGQSAVFYCGSECLGGGIVTL